MSALLLIIAGCGGGADDGARTDSTAAGTSPASVQPDTRIIVNGETLADETIRQLQQMYPVAIAPGRYWYDAVSGVWGRDGEPVAGQMMPGLRLGGSLSAAASRGASGVFINGRQLTGGEKQYLEILCQTPVMPARYWVLANGIGGYAGQPASFDLGQCPGVARQGGGSGGSSSRTYCDGNGACTTSGILGTITTSRD